MKAENYSQAKTLQRSMALGEIITSCCLDTNWVGRGQPAWPSGNPCWDSEVEIGVEPQDSQEPGIKQTGSPRAPMRT